MTHTFEKVVKDAYVVSYLTGKQIEEEEYSGRKWEHMCGACGKGFPTKHGLSVHQGRWCTQGGTTDYEVEKIVDVRGEPNERFFRVRWKGYGVKDDSWRNWRHWEHRWNWRNWKHWWNWWHRR